MTYVHITESPGVGLAQYRTVHEALGPEPVAGNLWHFVGECDGALTVVDIWESADAADRFAAERLFPALDRVGIRPGPDARVRAFEAAVETVAQG
ncbi:hypothetical protein ATM97_28115 [Nocardia sp. MH4]|jgi:hypothetical protein|uniref:hypothetical protein n=1 Tax=unclassified Nocardia TaxID=2637762 RepID=UPI001C4EC5BC|nr:hypothetical protein [Nocardia sp. MH4]MBW0275071.1 hypothetical protein [Nocardia sp. MH4]